MKAVYKSLEEFNDDMGPLMGWHKTNPLRFPPQLELICEVYPVYDLTRGFVVALFLDACLGIPNRGIDYVGLVSRHTMSKPPSGHTSIGRKP